MSQDLPYRTLGFLLHDAARLLRKRFEQKARAHGSNLTRAQWSVLAHLSRQEGVNQTTLADTLDVEPITVARAIDHEMKRLGIDCVYLDISHKPEAFIKSHFPKNGRASCRERVCKYV